MSVPKFYNWYLGRKKVAIDTSDHNISKEKSILKFFQSREYIMWRSL